MRRSSLAFLFLCWLAYSLSIIAAAQTIILVRHAEKVSNAPDATLSDVGKERSEKLGRMLADAGITAIYTSEVERTKQTAAPLAKLLKLEPIVVPAKDTSGLLGKLRVAPDSAVILVVGHSNTIPVITDQLLATGAEPSRAGIGPMRDGDYDRLYVVTLNPSAKPKLLVLHY
jgi:broad specificity phosphatase PhoE